MRNLILIKHSLPIIEPSLPAKLWRLGEEGRKRCEALAERSAVLTPAHLFCGYEPKAIETADLIGKRLALSAEPVDDLHEHNREHLPLLPQAEMQELVEDFFRRPDTLVFGEETAYQARDRFARAVTGIITAHPHGNLAIVAHGTVITLLVAVHNAIDPYSFWQNLALPDMVVLELPDYRLA